MGSSSVESSRWSRFFAKWRWKLCCAGVAAITYAAIYIALYLPGIHHGANFLLTAFPAAILQFLLIDMTRSGFSLSNQ